jgi:hypothetical protein
VFRWSGDLFHISMLRLDSRFSVVIASIPYRLEAKWNSGGVSTTFFLKSYGVSLNNSLHHVRP